MNDTCSFNVQLMNRDSGYLDLYPIWRNSISTWNRTAPSLIDKLSVWSSSGEASLSFLLFLWSKCNYVLFNLVHFLYSSSVVRFRQMNESSRVESSREKCRITLWLAFGWGHLLSKKMQMRGAYWFEWRKKMIHSEGGDWRIFYLVAYSKPIWMSLGMLPSKERRTKNILALITDYVGVCFRKR